MVALFGKFITEVGSAVATATNECAGNRHQIVSGQLVNEFDKAATLCSFAKMCFGILALVSFAITIAKPRKGMPMLGISIFATYLTHNLFQVCSNGVVISKNLNSYRKNLGVSALTGQNESFDEKKLSAKFLENTFHFDWAIPSIARKYASFVLEELKPPEKREK